jgi:hypothetical protein
MEVITIMYLIAQNSSIQARTYALRVGASSRQLRKTNKHYLQRGWIGCCGNREDCSNFNNSLEKRAERAIQKSCWNS